jgi:hypothetical protein
MSDYHAGSSGSSNNQLKLIFGIIFGVVAVGGILAWVYRDSLFGAGNTRLERELSRAVDMLNRRVPIRVDPVTTLTGATAEGNRVTYRYTISEDIPTERIAEAQRLLQQDIGSRLCAEPDMARAMREGAIIAADYRDASGDQIHVTFGSCPPAAR